MNVDIVIVGAGPSGLCLARSLSGQGLTIAVIEQQSLDAISNPAFDGREIALTQSSASAMKDLGLWQLIEPQAISQLRDAKILDGRSHFEMLIPHQLSKYQELGWLISNHVIRKAAYDATQEANEINHDITLIPGRKVIKVKTSQQMAGVVLDDQTEISAKLVVAADNRFSTTRRMMGIAADMHDFGRNMLVCCMTHDAPHDHIAWEWFDYGQTLALLPMNPDPETGRYRSSVVITVASDEAEELMKLNPEAFSRNAKERFGNRLGEMDLVSTIHSYPQISGIIIAGTITTASLDDEVTLPVLAIHHRQDSCAGTPVSASSRVIEGRPPKLVSKLEIIDGGITEGGVCESFAYHGFNQTEPEFIKKAAQFILSH